VYFSTAIKVQLAAFTCLREKQCENSPPSQEFFLVSERVESMNAVSPKSVTQLLVAWSEGDHRALEELVPLVHAELRRIARNYMRKERKDHTLETTALVNEAYLRLVDQKHVQWQNRAHFLAIASELMRRILVDYARRRQYQKRGGGLIQVTLSDATEVANQLSPDLVALDEALVSLAEIDPRRSRVVELRFFGGLSIEETAEVLKVSTTTVERDWTIAKAWLYKTVNNS
jgi:RNA polymerase sigma-70 factor, ECF subfamily